MLTVVVQAGGESRRMGQDKALLPFRGRPLIQRVIERLEPLADELLVTSNQPERYRFLNLPLFADILPGRGALGGLYTALIVARLPFIAVVACDMPFASAALFAAERDILVSSEADIAIPFSGDGLEPFHAVYRRTTCLPAIEAALRDGKWRADSWFEDVNVHILPPDQVRRYDPQMFCFRNVNTPGELEQAEKIAINLKESASADTRPDLSNPA